MIFGVFSLSPGQIKAIKNDRAVRDKITDLDTRSHLINPATE